MQYAQSDEIRQENIEALRWIIQVYIGDFLYFFDPVGQSIPVDEQQAGSFRQIPFILQIGDQGFAQLASFFFFLVFQFFNRGVCETQVVIQAAQLIEQVGKNQIPGVPDLCPSAALLQGKYCLIVLYRNLIELIEGQRDADAA